jgi:hypothetical protein
MDELVSERGGWSLFARERRENKVVKWEKGRDGRRCTDLPCLIPSAILGLAARHQRLSTCGISIWFLTSRILSQTRLYPSKTPKKLTAQLPYGKVSRYENPLH